MLKKSERRKRPGVERKVSHSFSKFLKVLGWDIDEVGLKRNDWRRNTDSSWKILASEKKGRLGKSSKTTEVCSRKLFKMEKLLCLKGAGKLKTLPYGSGGKLPCGLEECEMEGWGHLLEV